jgi:DNA polymerase III psi subunit
MILVILGREMLCFVIVIETGQVAALQQSSKLSKSWKISSDQPISANANEVLEDAFGKKGKT